MRATWLIEAGVYGDEALPLLQEIRRQGMAAEILSHQALSKGSISVVGGHPLTPDACVIGYGTFPFAQQILIHHPWVPGAYCSATNLDCEAYDPHFASFLLNQTHEILPGVEAIQQGDRLFTAFGRGGEVFARPTSCHKLFVGRRISREAFAAALAPTRYDPESRVVIASPKVIGREWRLVVADGRVIGGSRYAMGGKRAVAAEFPREVLAFAEAMLVDVQWRPDPVFMLDIAESEGRLWLVELNSFSGSWLYACELHSVVEKVSELAVRASPASDRR
jgi:hypothetical protein